MKPVKFNLINSLQKAVSILILILAVIAFFAGVGALLPFEYPLLIGIFEIINGLQLIQHLDDYSLKLIFTGILLSFGSLSIQTQIKSILKDYDLDYSLFYQSRIIHLILFMGVIWIRILIG